MSLLIARRTSRAAVLFAGLCLFAGIARAEEITTNLTGKVVSIEGSASNPDAAADLAALGVHVGTAVTATITIESTTPGVLVQIPYDFMQYQNAITDFSLTAGSWEVSFFAPSIGTLDFVQVANDAAPAGPKFKVDSWTGTATAQDSPDILSAATDIDYGASSFYFLQAPPKASKDDGLVQDLAKYKTDRGFTFGGAGGEIVVTFDQGGGGGGTTVDPTALARQGELKAAAKLGKSVLKGLGKLAAASPDKDPLGTKETALLQDSSDTFGIKFVAAVTKALKKGGSAPLGESDKQAATDYLMTGLVAQADALTAGVDENDPADRALRGKLLKALAAECGADFLAHATDAKKPDADKLAAKLAKSRATLAKVVGKALDKAATQGVVYAGPEAAAISDALTDFVDGFVLMTETGVP